MTIRILSLMLTVGAACAAEWPDAAALRAAVEQVRRSEDFQPREAFTLVQHYTPAAAADAARRRALAEFLVQAVLAPDTTALGRATLCQHLALVADKETDALLRKLLDDPSTAEAARIALRDIVGLPPAPEPAAVYLAAAADSKPAARVAGLSAMAHHYPAEAVPALAKAVRDEDSVVSATAIRLLVRLDGEALAREMPSLDAVRQAMALDAAADDRIPALRDAAAERLGVDDETVRRAAVRALGATGGVESVRPLAQLGADEALAQLAAPGVDDAIRNLIASGAAAARAAAIRAAVTRGMPDLTKPLLAAAVDADAAVRAESLKAIGRVGQADVYPVLIDMLGAGDSEPVVHAAKLVGRRIADPAARLGPIVARLDSASTPVPVKASLLAILPAFGGEPALAPVIARLAASDGPLRDAAVRALIEWPDGSAVPALYRVVDDAASSAAHRTLAGRALARLAPSPPGVRALVYLNCGEAVEAFGRGGARLRVIRGTPWAWAKGPKGTIATDPSVVQIEATGLTPGRSYWLGCTWWDFDNNGRAQSVHVNGRKVVDRTELPAWKDRKEPAARIDAVRPLTAGPDGTLAIEFRREAASNAVVSEIWIAEDPASSSVAPAPAVASAIPAPEVRANAGAVTKVLIVTGEEHHNWRATTPVLTEILARDARLEVSVVEDPRALALPLLAGYDVIVLHYQNPRKGKVPAPAGALENLIRTVESGRGLVLVHFASGAFIDWDTETIPKAFERLAGRVWNPKLRPHDPRGPFRVRVIDGAHPITQGLADFDADDELYTCLDGDTPIHVLASATSVVDRKDYPLVFVHTAGKGRVVHNALGHDVKALRVDAVGELYRRGVAWAAGGD